MRWVLRVTQNWASGIWSSQNPWHKERAEVQPIIDASFVGSTDDNLGEYQPGQERMSLVGFEAWDEAEDLVLVFRPQGNAYVASWEVGAVEDFPPYSGVLPGDARRDLPEENKARI